MRLLISTLFMFFTMISFIKAQDKEFIVGSVIGFNGIEINGDIKNMYSATDGRINGTGGLSFGFNVKHNLSKIFYGALELRYFRKGSIYEFTNTYGTESYEVIKLDYVEIPLLVGLKINSGKKPVYLETGFSFARLFSSKILVSELNEWDTSIKQNNFNKNDISLVANLKYPIIKNERLLIGPRLSHSLISIHSLYKLYNMDYGIEIYYLFNHNIN